MMCALQYIKRHTWWRGASSAVAAVLFLLLVYAVAYHGTDLWKLWLPTESYNDNVMYNRQLVGILVSGQPQGYFGYDESHALIGHFGAWGPILMYLYSIPAMLIGIGFNTMFWCNILFAVVGWSIFVCGAQLTWKRQLVFAIAVGCIWTPLQQIFSGSAEPLQYFLILIVLGSSMALRHQWRLWWYILLLAACFLTTATRAYTVLLWIYPMVLSLRRQRRWSVISAALMAVSLACYFAVTKWCNAPFFGGVDLDFSAATLLMTGKISMAVQYQIGRIANQIEILWRDYIYPTLKGEAKMQGTAFLVLLFLIVLTALSLVIDFLKKRAVRIRVLALIFVLVSLIALFSLYDMNPMARHCTMLALPLLVATVYEANKSLILCLPILLVPLVAGKTLMFYPLPTYSEKIDSQIQQIQNALQSSLEMNESEDPWSYTLAYSWGDNVFHGYLYAVPAGMGIEFDFNTYIADPANTIHSRYAMVGHGTDAEARLVRDGWQELVSTEDLIVYENTERP